MAVAAMEYCWLVEGFKGFRYDRAWAERMSALLPRLHVAVISMTQPDERCWVYDFPDDDARCELYMRLHAAMGSDVMYWDAADGLYNRRQLCDQLADDLTDMYFDLKCGLEVIEHDPQLAMENWQCSFYLHWGRHLLDAEYCLQSVDAGASQLLV